MVFFVVSKTIFDLYSLLLAGTPCVGLPLSFLPLLHIGIKKNEMEMNDESERDKISRKRPQKAINFIHCEALASPIFTNKTHIFLSHTFWFMRFKASESGPRSQQRHVWAILPLPPKCQIRQDDTIFGEKKSENIIISAVNKFFLSIFNHFESIFVS